MFALSTPISISDVYPQTPIVGQNSARLIEDLGQCIDILLCRVGLKADLIVKIVITLSS